MRCLSWNCCGLGDPLTKGELVALIAKKYLKLIFLMETKVDKDVIARICCKQQISNFFVVPHLSRGGGLAVLMEE